MKILEEKYPKGTLKGQKTDGRYVDETLYENIKFLSKAILKDMTFLTVVFSSTLEVGAGKSVFASQLGEVWTHLMKQLHGIEVPFDIKHCVFRPKDLIKRSFEVPKYSYIWLDEWEDSHYWSELGMTLRQFFRKCRQLNLFLVLIIPNFFQLPINYAISRSVCAIDVYFEDGFERGYFKFYNFDRKKDLYLNGKKTQNYMVTRPNFSGRFLDGYAVDEKEYRRVKLRDLAEAEAEEDKSPKQIQKEVKEQIFKTVLKNSKGMTVKKLSEWFGVSTRTAFRWLSSDTEDDNEDSMPDAGRET